MAARPVVTICMKGIVYDEKTGSRLSAEVKVVDLSTGKTVATTTSDSQKGSYIISLPALTDYAVHVSAKGYLFYSKNYNLEKGVAADRTWSPDHIDIPLKRLESGERIALRNVFFETNQYTLLEASQIELNKVVEVMKSNPTLKIELGGHTDNVGRPADNQRLSEQREGLVFLLWGNYAIEKQHLIDTSKHYVLTAPHPSPLSASRGFFGCRHFSKANEILMSMGKSPINWQL